MTGKGMHQLGWLVLTLLLPTTAKALTFTYDAEVTDSHGPGAALFSPGDPIVISYTLNLLSIDRNVDPQMGLFRLSLISLSVSFPDRGTFAVARPAGTVQTFNNVVDQPSGLVSDQVFFIGGPISPSSSLKGKPIAFLEVDFLSNFVALPNQPSMLSSDRLPLFLLPIIDASIFLGTEDGFTQVDFADALVRPSDPPNPPAVLGLTTPSLPDFRFWVRIDDQRIGSPADTPCPNETVCVSGAIGVRAEVFVRIVGPRGNGYLWPNIIKFNTTKTEVWIEQVSTGVTKYYLLPALDRNTDLLPGLVDKVGFRP